MPANDTPTTSFPQTKWAQQPEQLLLTISVPDINNIDVKFEEESVYFHGTTSDKTNPIVYEVKIDLYGKIDPAQSKYEMIGQKFWKILLKKQEPGSPFWPRLTKDTKKLHWLSVDFDHWIDEDAEEEEHAGPGGMPGGNFQDMFSGGMGGMPGMGGMGGMPGMGGMGNMMGGMGGMGGMPGMGGGYGDDDDLEGDDEHSGDELDEEKMPTRSDEKDQESKTESATKDNSSDNNMKGQGEGGLKQRAQGSKPTSNEDHQTTVGDVSTQSSSKEHTS